MNTNDTQQQKVETEDDGGWNLDFNDGLGDGLDFNDDDLDGMLSDGDMDLLKKEIRLVVLIWILQLIMRMMMRKKRRKMMMMKKLMQKISCKIYIYNIYYECMIFK